MSDQHADGAGMDGVRYEFMERLRALLMDLPQSVREEALQYYRDYLDDVGKEKEKAALKALGSPEQAAEDIRRGWLRRTAPGGRTMAAGGKTVFLPHYPAAGLHRMEIRLLSGSSLDGGEAQAGSFSWFLHCFYSCRFCFP